MKKCASVILTLCLFVLAACTTAPTSIDTQSTTSIETTSPIPSSSMEQPPETNEDVSSEESLDVFLQTEIDKTQYESLDVTEYFYGLYDGSFEKVYFTGIVLTTKNNELGMTVSQKDVIAYCTVDLPDNVGEYEPGNIVKIYGRVTGFNQDMSYPDILVEANLIETIDETAPVAETYTVLDAGVETEEQQQDVRDEADSFDLIAYWMDHSIYEQTTVGVTGYVSIAQKIGENGSAISAFTIIPQNVDAAVAVIATGNIDVEAGDVVTVYGSLEESENDKEDSVFTGFILTPTLIDVLDTESE